MYLLSLFAPPLSCSCLPLLMAETGRMEGFTGLPPPWKLHTSRRRAPDHPPYSEMIQTAISSLAEAGGSTVAAIDCHIRSAHRDLPWGHRNLLPYYLGKLVATGEITRTHSGRYSLDDDGSCCADAAPPPPPPPLSRTHHPSPPRKPLESENGTPSAPDFSTAHPHELGGDDDGLANGDLVEEDAPLAMLLPGHLKCALPQLPIRLLKRKLRERNASFSFPSSADPIASPLLRRRGRPPKPKAAIVFEDDQEEEAATGHDGRESEAKFVDFSSPAGPTGSPVLYSRGRPPTRNDAIVLKDEQHEAGCRDDPNPSSPSPNGGSSVGFPVMKRRGRPPKRASAVIIQIEQREAAAGHRDWQCEQMLVRSSSFIEDPVTPPVVQRRGRPPKPKAAMTLPDDGHDHESAAVAGLEGPQPELKLVAFSSVGDSTSSAASPPIKRRGRPPKHKAEACREPEPPKENAMAQSCKEGTEFALPGHGGTTEEAGVDGQDAIAAPDDEQGVSTRRGHAQAVMDEDLRRVTRSMAPGGEAQVQTDLNGPTCGKIGGELYDGASSGADWLLAAQAPWKTANAEARVNMPS